MKKFTGIIRSLLLVLLLLGVSQLAFADGTETLGDPSITIESGTGMVVAGVGLQDAQPGTININVPGDIVQVLAYWSGATSSSSPSDADDTIEVDGTEITGSLIGGPAYFFDAFGKSFYETNFRADITSLNLVSSGANALSIDGLDNKDASGRGSNYGAGILVIYDDGSEQGNLQIQIKDGLDLAFDSFPDPRKNTIPQTFTFAPAAVERTVNLVLFVSSVGSDSRTNTIVLDSDVGDIPDIEDLLASVDGAIWDTVTIPVVIPANATELTVELVSGSTNPGLPASINWIAAGIAPLLGSIGDYVWYDENGDGVQDAGENGLPGIKVRLLRKTGPDTYEVVEEQDTKSDGTYLFENLPPGDYLVDVFDPHITDAFPNGWVHTTNNDPYPTLGGAYTLAAGEHHRDADFGYDDMDDDKVGLGDTVFWDKNRSGFQDLPEEPGIPCVTVHLHSNEDGDNYVGLLNSDTFGNYYYTNMPPEDWYWAEVDLTDEDISNFFSANPTCNVEPEFQPTALTLNAADSIPTTGTKISTNKLNVGGEFDPDLDFGFVPTAISLASFEVAEASSMPWGWALVGGLMALLGTGAWLLRRRQEVK